MQVKGDRRAVIEHRKFYTGYLKGMRRASYVRGNLMQWNEYSEIEEVLLQYAEQLVSGNEIVLKEKE
jgi:tRNA-dihydrouridine synthase